MEPNSATHSAFATPELVLLVGAHLASPDLAHCMRVCKAWMRQFEPILWAHFCPKSRPTDRWSLMDALVATAGLMRNLPHLRTLDLSKADSATLGALAYALASPFDKADRDQSLLCTNLRTLHFGNPQDEPLASTSIHLAALLNHNRLLTHLELSYDFLTSSAVLEAISDLRHLQHITIASFEGGAMCRDTLLMLKACLHLPELTELHFIDMDLDWDEVDGSKEKDMPDVEIIIKEASIAQFSLNPTATKIKSLRLPSNRFGARNPLPFLLLKSDLLDLESCVIPWFRNDADIKEIEQVVRERCPNLKHLICHCLRGERDQDGAAVRAFIRGCSGLKSFTAELFSDYDAESFDPKYFNDDYSDRDPRYIIEEVRSHYKTLEVLDLTDCIQVFSEDQQNILNLCHQLKRFWVTDSYGEGSMVGIESTDISSSYWACSELKELGLVLNLYPKMEDKFDIMKDGTYEDEDWDDYDLEELVVKATKQVYTQIGQMKNLEVLALDIDRSYETHMKVSDFAGNLTICGGHLEELAGLKELKRLQLRADFWSAMGQAEVEFMYKNWPLLSEITLCCKVSELRALPHWQWLLSKRPQLRLAGEHDQQQ